MGFKELPRDLEELSEKRKTILKTSLAKSLKKPNEFYTTPKTLEWNIKVKQINDSFELLRSYLTNSFESNRQMKNLTNLEAQGFCVNLHLYLIRFGLKRLNSLKLYFIGEGQVLANGFIIGTCLNRNKNNRLNMEDTNIILDDFGNDYTF